MTMPEDNNSAITMNLWQGNETFVDPFDEDNNNNNNNNAPPPLPSIAASTITHHTKTSSKKKKKKKASPPGKKGSSSGSSKKKYEGPKKPLSAYNLYFSHARAELLEKLPVRAAGKPKRSHGKIGFADMGRLIGSQWKALDESSKAHFEYLAAKDKERYAREVFEWKSKKNNNGNNNCTMSFSTSKTEGTTSPYSSIALSGNNSIKNSNMSGMIAKESTSSRQDASLKPPPPQQQQHGYASPVQAFGDPDDILSLQYTNISCGTMSCHNSHKNEAAAAAAASAALRLNPDPSQAGIYSPISLPQSQQQLQQQQQQSQLRQQQHQDSALKMTSMTMPHCGQFLQQQTQLQCSAASAATAPANVQHLDLRNYHNNSSSSNNNNNNINPFVLNNNNNTNDMYEKLAQKLDKDLMNHFIAAFR